MKRKDYKRGAKAFRSRQKGWLGRLFTRKPKPLMSRSEFRQAKLLAAATRRASLILALSAVVVAALFWMVISVPPQISPEQLAANVKAQRVHRLMASLPSDMGAARGLGSVSTTANAREVAQQPKADESGYSSLTFQRLSGFHFFVTDQMVDKASDMRSATWSCLTQIPEDVRALNEKEVSVRGFMLPMKYDGRLTTQFLLLKNQSLCCYGMPPKITEWVNVRVPGKGVKPIMDVPVTVCGVFHVGDVRENGELVGIYSLDAQKVKGPRE